MSDKIILNKTKVPAFKKALERLAEDGLLIEFTEKDLGSVAVEFNFNNVSSREMYRLGVYHGEELSRPAEPITLGDYDIATDQSFKKKV